MSASGLSQTNKGAACLQEGMRALPRMWLAVTAMLAVLCLAITADASVGLVKQLRGPEDVMAFGRTMHRTLLQSKLFFQPCHKCTCE